MIRIEFSEQDLDTIKRLRYAHPHPRVRRRMDVLWLKSQGLAHQDVCRLAGVSSNTVRKYLRLFQDGGIKKLAALNFYAPISDLERHRAQLEAHFRAHPPATLNEAAATIELLYLPTYSPNLNLIERLWKFVKKKVLYSEYYDNFSDFRNAITDCLNPTHTAHKKELDSLLALNFQTFKKCHVVPI